MAETLGSLCDKLTIVKLKQWHSEDAARQASLAAQQQRLQEEIDQFIGDAATGRIAPERLTFAANKVFKAEGNFVAEITGQIGEIFAQLATVNCELWHTQEKVYDFPAVPAAQKDAVIQQLAVLNLQRNKCIDHIDRQLQQLVENAVAARLTLR